jgi:cyclic lactone autoinducer peptide
VKKVVNLLGKAMAALTYQAALKGAGLASGWGWYQPKVPVKLCK